jgi:hypothetical protein
MSKSVDVDVVETAEADVSSAESAELELESSVRMGVGLFDVTGGTSVVRGASDGRFGLPLFTPLRSLALYPFQKVFRKVGEVADNVSNRKLVVPFPSVDGESVFEVLSVSLGRFEGEGLGCTVACPTYVKGEDGRMASDMPAGGVVQQMSIGSGGDCGTRASMIFPGADAGYEGSC